MAKLRKIDAKVFSDHFEPEEEEQGEVTEWSPSLSGSQQELFESTSKYILAYGERASGKTFVLGGHKLVRHAYENFNALCLVVVGVKSQATQGGIWHKLQTEILPKWHDGLGIEHTDQKMDLQKAPYIDIRNRYGGWSRISLMSAPHGNILIDRIKGFEPSYVFVDELTNLDTPSYFNAIVQQLGRRQGIEGVQQYCAACNPAGPSHWVYKRFFEAPYDEDGNYNHDYHVVHVKIAENEANLPPGYYARIMEAVTNDPIEAKRMLEGEWIDRPSGDALLAPYYNKSIHVVGDAKKGIVPNPDFPVIIGYDPGSVNNACIFMQCLVGRERSVWTVFDELVTINKKIPYTTLIPLIYRKMKYWTDKVGKKLNFVHISDNSAFNQFRAKTGSYDVRDFEEISKEKCEVFDLEPIRMKAAPKFQGSVEGRVRLMISKLVQEEILISAQCTDVLKSIRNLASSKQENGKYDPSLELKPRRSVYIHAFDALTYPIMFYDVKSGVPRANVKTASIIEINA
jgi:hypothetical protein